MALQICEKRGRTKGWNILGGRHPQLPKISHLMRESMVPEVARRVMRSRSGGAPAKVIMTDDSDVCVGSKRAMVEGRTKERNGLVPQGWVFTSRNQHWREGHVI